MRFGSVRFVAILALAFGACSPSPSPSRSASPTEPPLPGPSFAITCTAPATPTPAEPEGPSYRPGAPERTIFFGPEDREGETLVVGGAVLDTQCEPVAGATLDIWHADPFGVYDETGFRFRGRTVTGGDGTFRFDTLEPGSADDEPPQLHVRVTGPGKRALTTQLYLPAAGANTALQLAIQETEEARVGSFTFVLEDG